MQKMMDCTVNFHWLKMRKLRELRLSTISLIFINSTGQRQHHGSRILSNHTMRQKSGGLRPENTSPTFLLTPEERRKCVTTDYT